MNTRAMLQAGLISFALIPSALAEPAAAEPAKPSAEARIDTAPRPEKRSEAMKHDGFYLRAAMGFGGYGEGFRSKSTARYGGESGGTASGLATVGELALGYTVAPGLVLGGGVYTASVLSSTFDADDGVTVPKEVQPKRRNFAIAGPFVDWYPDARKGFHLQAAVGVATLDDRWRRHDSTTEPEYVALGAGAMCGVGYEWFVADEWSIGVMARMTGAVVTGTDDNDVRFYHGIGTSPSLLLSATYN